MQGKPIQILSIDDDLAYIRLVREMFSGANGTWFILECADRLSIGLERLAEGDIDIVLLEPSLPDSQGLDTFARVWAEAAGVPIVVLTELDDETLAVEMVREGAQDYLVKEWTNEHLLARVIRYAVERERTEEALHRRTEELEALRQTALELTAQLDLEAVLHFVVFRAMELLDGSATGLALFQLRAMMPHMSIIALSVDMTPGKLVGDLYERPG